MKFPRGPLYNIQKEQVVVIRNRDVINEDLEGFITYGRFEIGESDFQIIVEEDAEFFVVIHDESDSISEDGIALTESDYTMTVRPPNNRIRVGDIIIRIDKNGEDLRITRLSQRNGNQEVKLDKRGKAETYIY